MEVHGLSARNEQPEPPARKPNEDFFGYYADNNILVAVVMDGIPVLRDEDGNYPEENGSIASQIAVREMCNFLSGKIPNSNDFLAAFRFANTSIFVENGKRKTYERKEPQWIATVGCALWADFAKNLLYFGYIGDPLAFSVSYGDGVELLTEDQLKPFESHLYAAHRNDFTDPGITASIREHQDRYVRNVIDSKCFCGEPLRGWGALTGQSSAMNFMVARRMRIFEGLRVILASDAIEAIGAGNTKERKAEDYRDILLQTLDLSPKKTAEYLLKLTRAGEKEKKCKSDDATFIVVDF